MSGLRLISLSRTSSKFIHVVARDRREKILISHFTVREGEKGLLNEVQLINPCFHWSFSASVPCIFPYTTLIGIESSLQPYGNGKSLLLKQAGHRLHRLSFWEQWHGEEQCVLRDQSWMKPSGCGPKLLLMSIAPPTQRLIPRECRSYAFHCAMHFYVLDFVMLCNK